MSSDPIEVLREAVTALKTMHGPFDHDYIKDEMCCDRCRLLVLAESALAPLSAPKPESAEAVPAGYVQIAKPALREMIGDERMAQIEAMSVYPTAPPRPEASAPVGVEGLIEAAKAAESMLRTVHECASHGCEDCREYAGISAKQLRAALAGQSLKNESEQEQQGGPQE